VHGDVGSLFSFDSGITFGLGSRYVYILSRGNGLIQQVSDDLIHVLLFPLGDLPDAGVKLRR
jgi:hypothetical protein